MSTIVLLKPGTDAGTSQEFDSSQCDSFTVMADNLDGAETVGIFVMAGSDGTGFGNKGGTPVVVGLPNGDPAKLTVTNPALPLEGGPRYRFEKDATTGACGIYISVKDHV